MWSVKVNNHFLLPSGMYPTLFIFFVQAQMLSAARAFSFRTSHPLLVITPYENVLSPTDQCYHTINSLLTFREHACRIDTAGTVKIQMYYPFTDA
jgi:hypothetical protein